MPVDDKCKDGETITKPWRKYDMSNVEDLEAEHIREIRELKKFWRNTAVGLLAAFVGQLTVGGGALLYMGMLLKQVDVTTALSIQNSRRIESIYGEQQRRTVIINQAEQFMRHRR